MRRELRSGELRLLFAALLIAVAAVTAVGFFGDRVRQGQLLMKLWNDDQRAQAALEHPLRLVLAPRDVADDGLVQAALGARARDVAVVPPEAVVAECLEVLVLGRPGAGCLGLRHV